MSLRQIGRSAAQDLVLLLEQLDPLVRLPQRVGLATRLWRARRPGRVLLVDRQPALQTRRRDTEVLGDLGHRGIGLPVDPDHILAKLLGERLRHDAHPSSADTHRRRSDVTYPCSSPIAAGALALALTVGACGDNEGGTPTGDNGQSQNTGQSGVFNDAQSLINAAKEGTAKAKTSKFTMDMTMGSMLSMKADGEAEYAGENTKMAMN